MEVKEWPKRSNKEESDKVKVGKQLQIALSKFIVAGVEKPVVVSLLVEGKRFKVQFSILSLII